MCIVIYKWMLISRLSKVMIDNVSLKQCLVILSPFPISRWHVKLCELSLTRPEFHFFLHEHKTICTGWAKKTGLFFRLDNFMTVSPRKACSMSKFLQFYREKVQNWHFNEFKYSLPNLLKSSQQLKLCYIWPEHMDFTQFALTYSETTVIFPQS